MLKKNQENPLELHKFESNFKSFNSTKKAVADIFHKILTGVLI